MKTEILISCDDWENRVAVLEEGALAEIYFEREEKVIGSIYKGRVENVLPGMGACFVNIGLGRNAFLYVDDIRRDPINIGETEITDRRRGSTVGELLRVGDEILVQIVKEPRGLKGARVSTNISLPGRYLVLMPTGRYSGVSSRIEDEQERNRLKQIMRRVRPEGMATIVRTAATNVSEAELIADLGVQLRLWHSILESYKRASAPSLLHKDLNLVFKAVRDFLTSDVEEVLIDSKEQYEEIRNTMALFGPQYLSRLKLWQGPGNLFAVRGIDEELQKLLKPKIFLPSGGHLVLESTEALTVVDVNTGKFTGGKNLEDTLVRTNIEAAAEVARQVRLRDIGGIIVVDFIDMAHERSRAQVIATLSDALRRDRTRSTIQEFSNLGLLEFTRKRVGKDLAGQLRSECPYCAGLGTVMSSETLAIALLRQIRQTGIDGGNNKNYDIVIDPSVATQLMGWYREEFDKLAKSMNAELRLFVQPHRHREQIVFEPAHRQRRPVLVGKDIEADLLPVRMPDPSSGIAVVDGMLIEVKDAASGAGLTAKLKITSVDANIAHAELAEPLQVAKRRRRRGRSGRAAAEGEETKEMPRPPATPAPARVDRIAMPRNVFGLEEDEEEEDYTLRGGRQAGGAGRGSARRDRPVARAGAAGTGRRDDARREAPRRDDARREAPRRDDARREAPRRDDARREAPRRDEAKRDEGRRDESRRTGTRPPARGGRPGSARGGRPGRAPETRGGFQPLIVGGESDIDYDDDDDSAVVIVPEKRQSGLPAPAAAQETEESAEAARRRRRRRRGRGGRAAPSHETAAGDEETEDELVVADTPAIDDEEEARPRDSDAPEPRRPRRFFGPVKQLYGAPVDLESANAPIRERPRREGEREPRVREPRARDQRERTAPAPRAPRPPQDEFDEDELDVVIGPSQPAAIDVEFQEAPPPRMRPREPREDRGPREPREDRGPREPREDRGPREPRDGRGPGDRPERPPGGRGGREDRGGRGRGRGRSDGTPRTVKQLYPPPGSEPEPVVEGGTAPKNPPMGRRRPSHGAMKRQPGAAPPPKGKIRQLYPPPPDDEFETPMASQRPEAHTPDSSLFVTDEDDLDERRLRARERAEERRREDAPDGGPPEGAPHFRAPIGEPFIDETEE